MASKKKVVILHIRLQKAGNFRTLPFLLLHRRVTRRSPTVVFINTFGLKKDHVNSDAHVIGFDGFAKKSKLDGKVKTSKLKLPAVPMGGISASLKQAPGNLVFSEACLLPLEEGVS